MARRREVFLLLLCLVLGVQAMPLALDSSEQVLLSERQASDPAIGELTCHTKTDQSEKLACCKAGLEEWRGKQALYQDYDEAETAKMSAAEETEALIATADAAKAKWEQSETKRIFEEGVRQCSNSPNAYKLPEASRDTAVREQAQEDADAKKESADAASKSANDAIQKQGEAMADYVKVANGIDAENAKANAAEAEVEKAAIEKAQADEEVQLSEQNALATDQEATDATAELENAETQSSGAEKALQDAKDEFATQKTAMDERIAELKETEEDTLDAKTTADDAAQAAQDGYDSETEEVAKAAALASVESTKSEAEAASDAAVEASSELQSQEQAKIKLVEDSEGAITQMTTEEDTAKQDVKMAKALLEEKRQNKDEADQQLSTSEGDAHSKSEAAAAAAADSATAKGELDQADQEKTDLKQKADTAAAEAKEASDMQNVLEQEASDKSHAAKVAVKAEEAALAASAQANKDAEAVKWDEQYDVLKQKISTVNDMYNKFVNCVKDSKWEC